MELNARLQPVHFLTVMTIVLPTSKKNSRDWSSKLKDLGVEDSPCEFPCCKMDLKCGKPDFTYG